MYALQESIIYGVIRRTFARSHGTAGTRSGSCPGSRSKHSADYCRRKRCSDYDR